jgi:MSHA pilin protein MshD
VSQYKNYLLSVSVTYPNANRNSKLIAISVTTPSGEAIIYDAIRSNY